MHAFDRQTDRQKARWALKTTNTEFKKLSTTHTICMYSELATAIISPNSTKLRTRKAVTIYGSLFHNMLINLQLLAPQ